MHTRVSLALLVALPLAIVTLSASADRSLAATAASQRIQNARADADDLSRMRDDAMVARFRRSGLLVPIALSAPGYYVHQVPARYRYLRPWARLLLTRLSRQFHARFGTRLRVTAMVRTSAYQRRLDGRNPNAAAATGPRRSSHLTGATLDISKRFMTAAHLRWMRRVLSGLHQRDVVYAIEEFAQPCFHVMVHRSYQDYVKRLS